MRGLASSGWGQWSSSTGSSSFISIPLGEGLATKKPRPISAGAFRVRSKSFRLLGRGSGQVLSAPLGRDGRSRGRHVSRMGQLDKAHGRVWFMTGFWLAKVPSSVSSETLNHRTRSAVLCVFGGLDLDNLDAKAL